jgi:predicted DNA-binding transcriptional regulator AlpA
MSSKHHEHPPETDDKPGQIRPARITAMLRDEAREEDVIHRQHRAGRILDPEPLPFEKPWDKTVVAAFLGVTSSGLDKLVRMNKAPPYFRSGRLMRWRPSVVRKWAEDQEAAAIKQSA